MDVRDAARSVRRLLLAAGLHFAVAVVAHADPIYNAVDLGTGSVTYGVDSTGNGTVTGSNGLTYTFDPVQNALPAQWRNATQGVPTVTPAPVGDGDTYGNPNNAYSYSSLNFMNNQGLAAGINYYGVNGHMGNGEAFLTQQQANGLWGAPIPLWSGADYLLGPGKTVGIIGVSPNGQVLGYGSEVWTPYNNATLYLYDSKTQSLINLTNLVDSMKWTTSTQLPVGQSPNWFLSSDVSQLDNQGRILVQASEGFPWPEHNLLLIPQGLSSDPVAAPEPATWAVFATLIGGWLARKRLCLRSRR
jgi:hypothetical protein